MQAGEQRTCPHLHVTRLHPEIFSTLELQRGQGLVLAATQCLLSLSPVVFFSHIRHLHAGSRTPVGMHRAARWRSVPAAVATVQVVDISQAEHRGRTSQH